MKKRIAFLSIAAFSALFGLLLNQPAQSAGSLNVSLVTFATGLDASTDIANMGDGRLFSVGQDGYVEIVLSNGTVLGTPFLDIDARVISGGEQGLLGLAFHPDYTTHGFVYVY